MLIDPRKEEEITNKKGFTPNVQNAVVPASYSKPELCLFIALSVLTLSIYFFIIWVGKRNWFNKKQIQANQASSNVEIQLKYRKDALVKLVEATKSSIKFEKSTLTDITALRSSNSFDSLDNKTGQKNVALLDKVGSKITATLENYPKLKSVEAIQQLMTVADYAEREIAASRRLYNATVEEFNVALYQFPTKIVAKHNKLYNLPLFAASASDKEDVSLAL